MLKPRWNGIPCLVEMIRVCFQVAGGDGDGVENPANWL